MSYNPQNPNGPGTVATSQPVNIASDQLPLSVSLSGGATSSNQTNGSQQTKLTDGTNVANVLNPGTANSTGNAVLVSGTTQSIIFSTSTSIAVASTDAGNYTSVSVIFTSLGTAATNQFQVSNDNTNWANINLFSETGGITSGGLATGTAYYGSLPWRYFRINVSGITGSTTAGTVVFSTLPPAASQVLANQQGSWTVGASSTIGSGIPSTAFLNGVSDGTSLRAVVQPSVASGTTGTGLVGAGDMGIYNSTIPTASNGNYYQLQLDAQASLRTTQLPTVAGGLSIASGSIGATATPVKSSAGQVYGWYFYNNNSAVSYVQFFNQSSGITLGTTVPIYSLGIPPSGGANVFMPQGIYHSTGIGIAMTTTRAGSTSPTNTVDYNIFYF